MRLLYFFNFDLGDDANMYALMYDLDDFNREGETYIESIITDFEKWLHLPILQQKFKKEYDRKLEKEEKNIKMLHKKSLNQIDEIGSKRRTQKRTSRIKYELSVIVVVPDDREHAVKGKI